MQESYVNIIVEYPLLTMTIYYFVIINRVGYLDGFMVFHPFKVQYNVNFLDGELETMSYNQNIYRIYRLERLL